MSILDGMTLDEAKDCIGKQIRKNGEISVLIVGKRVFICPDQAGLKARCGMTFSEQLETGGHKTCEECWTAALTAHYAQPETRWMEPQLDSLHLYDRDGWIKELMPRGMDFDAEIARTNARRYLEAWRDANKAAGEYCIFRNDVGEWRCFAGAPDTLGEIKFTKEAAQYIIDHKPELLRALMPGVQK